MNSIIVFVILLFALVFLGWYSGLIDKSAISSSESFVTFQYDIKEGATIPVATPIPAYAGTSANQNISKVFDNVFYDVNNGNLIEIDSTPYDGKVSDVTGSTISNVWISCRKNAGSPIVSYTPDPKNPSVTTTESQLPFTNSFKNFVYLTKSKNTDPYVVFYMPWNDSTFIHMINLKTNQNAVTELYYGVVNMSNTILYTSSPVPDVKTLKPVVDTDANNNKFITLAAYDKNYSIYQLCSNLYFDVRNGQVVDYDPTSKSMTVYARNGTILTTGFLDNKTVTQTSFATWLMQKTSVAKIMLYMSIGQKTMIAIIEPDGNTAYRLFNLQRFLKTGVDTGASESSGSGTGTGSSSGSSGSASGSDSMMSDYYKWYYYWVNKGVQDPNSHNFNYSDDYMLKTQIVPPVCPACSTSVGTCVQCSGQTGGTVGANGTSVVGGYPVSNIDSNSSTSNSTSSSSIKVSPTPSPSPSSSPSPSTSAGGVVNNTVDSGSGLLYATGSGATNLVRDTGSGVANFTKDAAKGITKETEKAVTGTVGLGREIVGGTVGLGKDIVGGTVGLGKDIVGGTVGLGKDIVGGIVGLGKRAEPGTGGEDPSRGGYSNSYAGNGSNSVTDKYSYYGAVPNKGGNYVPIMSDFSRFGR